MNIGAVDLFKQLADNNYGFFQKITAVGDLMTPSPRTLSLDDTLEDALKFFRIQPCHHAPVIEPESDEVVGIVSDRDVLRFRPFRLGTLAERDEDALTLRTSLAQIMTRSPVHLAASDSPVEALNLMIDNRMDSVLVYEDRKQLQGIVTPRDVAKTLLLFRKICSGSTELQRLRLVDLDLERGIPADEMFDRGAQTVRDVMTRSVTTVGEDQTIQDAIELMQANSIRHLPVVDERTQLVGVISDRELLGRLPAPSGRKLERCDEQRFRDILFDGGDAEALRDPIRNNMRRDFVALSPVTLFTECVQLFEGGESGFPVVDDVEGALCGIITTTDLLRVCRTAMMLGATN